MTATMTMQNWNKPSHVTMSATPFLSIGGKEVSPPKKQGAAYPWYW